MEEIKEFLKYIPEIGKFYWIKSPSNRIKIGDEAGYYGRYITIDFKGITYLAHKLAWYYTNNIYPKEEIDHINQNTHDNKISNLRIVTAKENAANKPKRRDNTSGITGVSFDKWSNKWVVRIKNQVSNKYENRGRFNTIDEAKSTYNKAIRELGYHKNHGKKLSGLPYRSK